MNHVFYVIPLLLVISIPTVFAEVGQNYDTVTNEDGTVTWSSHPNRILVGDEWNNYFVSVDNQKVIFNSNSIGGLTFDIDSCSYSLYENGYNGSQIIPSVSIVGTHNNNGTWENLAVNDVSCLVDVIQNDNGIILTSTKTLVESKNFPIVSSVTNNSTGITSEIVTDNFQDIQTQKLTHTLQIDITDGIKETFQLWDDSGNELGISQTIHTDETITIADNVIDIEALSGQSFDRQFIIDNEAEILKLTDSVNYDFDIGIDSLSNINIIYDDTETIPYKVNLDYANGNFTNYLYIDPTFTNTGSLSGSNWNFDLSSLSGIIIISSGDIDGTSLSASQITDAQNNIGSTWTTTANGTFEKAHTFTSSGTFQITSGSGDVDYLIVAGGGGGGGSKTGNTGGAGGGAGGLLSGTVSKSTGSYTVTIGTGGAGGIGGYGTDNGGAGGSDGTDSVFDNLTSIGGGGGAGGSASGTWAMDAGNNGGSGGGSSTYNSSGTGTGTTGQGNNGGQASSIGGGGGGAGGAGGTGSVGGGAGGSGTSSSITGTATYYAGGGGGGAHSSSGGGGSGGSSIGGAGGAQGSNPGSNGVVNTGSGGGGGSIQAGWGDPDGEYGGNGSDGIVIVRYDSNEITATGGTITSINNVNSSPVLSFNYIVGVLPDAPTGLTSTIQDANNAPLDVFLQWSSPVSWGTGTAQGFEVYRNGVLITTTGLVNSYTDTVTAGTHSHYVKAISSHGSSANSNTANITTPSVPDAITDLSGNIISDTQINVTWTAPNDGGSNIDLYKIFKDGSQVDTTTNTSYSLTGLTANTAYTITVYANNSVGDSLVSNSVNLTTYQSVSGSITVTPNTQGASTQLTFSASGITGTPTPTFNTFTLKEGVNVIASGISSPYTLALNDNSPHTYTVTSTDNTHWDTPTISGNTTVTATYDPNWSNGVSYNYTRANNVLDLTVNQNTQSLWDASCNYKTTAQVMADQTGIVSNFTNVWYINDNQTISDTDTVYVSCNEDGTTLFSFTSFGPNRLGGGIAQLDDVFGDMTGTPVALIFVLLVAGLFTGRSAPTGILLVLALIGVLGFIGMLTIDEAVWGFLLLAGVLGIFLGKRFL